MKIKIIFINSLLILGSHTWAQDTIRYEPSLSYSFINHKVNAITHTELLAPFYEKLVALKNNSARVVNIIHIGDSHIQADYLTSTTRTLLQQEFGNAGLGLTFPGRVARTNESPNIYSSSTHPWEGNRITNSQSKQHLGITGASLKTEVARSKIHIKIPSHPTHDYSFNKMKLFFQKEVNSYNLIVKDSLGQSLAIAGAFTEEPYHNVSKIALPYSINQVDLETIQSLSAQNQFTLFGLSLENSNSGILYHIVGVNGSKYRHFISSKDLLDQTAALTPDLLILSLGTNEAVDHPHIDSKLGSQITMMIAELKSINPNAIILLTTPADFYKKRTRRNPGVQIIRTKILEAAGMNTLPFWDLFTIAGGNHSADRWKKEELLQQDGIHFTKKGYQLQGYLLYEAIIKGYNEYVLHRLSKTH